MNTSTKKIKIFQDNNGKEPFAEWIDSLSLKERSRIFTRLDRVETGNMGDHRSVGGGVGELRFHFGPGYRVYYGETGNTVILLLCGGDKSSQNKDIKKAKAYWRELGERGEI